MTKPRVKIKIKHPKRRGEWAEMRFMAMAAENGLEVTKPFGEMARYDFIVEHKGKFARVQVKSTIRTLGSGYACTMRGWRDPYGRNEFDFVAVYLILEDLCPDHSGLRGGVHNRSVLSPWRSSRGQVSYPVSRHLKCFHADCSRNELSSGSSLGLSAS